jgi:hypothetical protein
MAGQECPCCCDVIAPGDRVAYQEGVLMHLDCYAKQRAEARARDEEGI